MRILSKILALLILGFCALGCSVLDADSMPSHEKTTIVRVGDVAPDFTVTTLAGERVSVSDYQGQTLLLVFFASWCPDCHELLARLEGVAERFADRKFDILVVSRGEERSDVYSFITSKNYEFTVALDPRAECYSLYATQYIPRCFVIDPLGHIVAMSTEYDEDEFEVLMDVVDITACK